MHYIQTQTINISIYVNKLLSASPLTLILSSLVKFDKGESKFEEKKCLCVCVCGGEGGGSTLTPKLYAKLCQLRSSTEIHNVEHVVNSTFLNLKTLILSSLLSVF